MPIIQYSKMKQRRGLLEDLPVLDDSQLGHALDARRLFIGNGQVADGAPIVGNTEILTEFSPLADIINYTYKSNTSVEATTGNPPSAPVFRTLQERLDDYLSIKAYGAVGDASTDDTDAINRALADIYTNQTVPLQSGYRIIFFPAGVYVLETDAMCVPPNTILVGEGKDRTIILQKSDSHAVLETVDGDLNREVQIGDSSAVLPDNIYLHNMSLVREGDFDILRLYRVSNISFIDCRIYSDTIIGAGTGKAINIDPLGMAYAHQNINFRNCDFGGMPLIAATNAPLMNGVNFSYCTFNEFEEGFSFASTEYNVNINNCHFANIGGTVIRAGEDTRYIKSSGNMYENCGSAGLPPVGNPVIVFESGSTGCTSLNDSFLSSNGVISVWNDDNTGNFILGSGTDFVFGNVTVTKKLPPITLNAASTNVSTGLTFDLGIYNSIYINYTIKRNGMYRIGKITIFSDGDINNTAFDDYYTETDNLDVELNISIAAGVVSIMYTTLGLGLGELHCHSQAWKS